LLAKIGLGGTSNYQPDRSCGLPLPHKIETRWNWQPWTRERIS